jgi:hypothetical protein
MKICEYSIFYFTKEKLLCPLDIPGLMLSEPLELHCRVNDFNCVSYEQSM